MAPRTPKDPEKKPTKAKPAGKPTGSASAPPAKPNLKVVEKPAISAKAPVLKLKDLIDQVATATGTKKPEAKKTVEAVLAAMSTALKSGSALALPPLGKLRVARSAGSVMTLKLRQADGSEPAGKPAGKPLADDGDDD